MTPCNSKSGKSSKSSLAKLVGQKANPIEYQVLEPRMVFDGAAAVTAADIADGGSDAPAVDAAADSSHAGNVQDLVAALAAGGPAAAAAGVPAQGSPRAIVFIDGAVTDPGALAIAAPAGAEIVMLNANSDGLAQIAAYLSGRSNIDAVHIISHGTAGDLILGNAHVNSASIASAHADELAVIKSALSADGDIAIYGCNVAAGVIGETFVSRLADATGADIAASVDDTGSARLGANWTLEMRLGLIEANLIDAPEWNGELAPLTITTTAAPTVTGATGTNAVTLLLEGGTGLVGLWTNAGTIGSTSIDLRATVTGLTASTVSFFTLGDDPSIIVNGPATATIKWEIFASGTSQTVIAVGSPNFQIADIDGVGGIPNTRESVRPSLNGLTAYTTETVTNLVATTSASGVLVSGTQNQNGESNSLVRFTWNDVSTWTVSYTLAAGSGFGNAVSRHDGDGDFTFVAPNTVSLLTLDLDDNNSTAAGTAYQATYVENSAPIRIADLGDVAIVQNSVLGTTLGSATIVLTNAQANDVLSVGSLPSGISATIDTSVTGKITVTLTGSATVAAYQTALQSILFSNTSDQPSTTDRQIEVSVKNTVLGTSSLTALSTIHVTPVNDAPADGDETNTVTEDTTLTVPVATGLLANTVDPDGATAIITGYTIAGIAGTQSVGSGVLIPGVGTITISADGSYSFAPATNYTGAIPVITYTVSDGALTDTSTLSLSMLAVNDPPVDGNETNSVTEDTTLTVLDGAAGDLLLNASDVDGNPLTITSYIIAGVAGTQAVGVPVLIAGIGTITINGDGSYSFAPAADYAGSIPVITYTVSDGNGGTDTSTLALAMIPINDAPADGDETNTVTEDTTLTVPVATGLLANTVDPDGDTLSITGFTIAGIAGTQSVGSGVLISGVGTISISADGSYSFAPATNYTGAIPVITYTVSDSNGGTNTSTLTLAMIPVNDAPVAMADTGSVSEDGPAAMGNVITGPGTDSDVDGGPLSVTLANKAGSPITLGTPFTVAGGGTLTLNANGAYTFNPGTAYNGLDAGETATETISYTISDGNGGSASAMLVITINGANDAPVVIDPANPGTPSNPLPATDPANIIPDVATTDGQALTPINVGSYIVDPDGEPLTFTLDPTVPAWVIIDPVTGIITGTPPANASQASNTGNPGEYLITITATDPDGALVTTTVTLSIVNLPPIAVNDTGSASEDGPVATGNVLTDPMTGDRDTAPDSDPLTVTLANQAGSPITLGTPFTVAGGGTLTLNADGSYTFNPGTAYNGLDAGETATETISYTISDGAGGTASAMLVITINGANDAPVVIDPANPGTPSNPLPATDPANIIPDVTRTDGQALTPINVGSYIVDPDGEPLTFTLDPTVPAWVIIDPVTGIITGTPPANASQASNTGNPGEYLITITATDPDGALVTTTVTLSIVNLPPVAVNDTGSASEDGPVATGNVLTGAGADTDTAPDSDPLIVVAINGDPALLGEPVAGSTGGLFTLNPDGSWSFDPGRDFDNLAAGTTRDTVVTYRVSDGNGGTAQATITITVTGVNDAPVALGPIAPQTVVDSVPVSPIITAAAFTNPTNMQLAYTASNLPDGLVINPLTGVITGTPASDASVQGPYIVTVTATGPNGETSTVQLQLEVVNPPLVAADDQASTPSGTAVKLAPLANDRDPDGDDLIITAITPPANGTAMINPDGTISYLPNPGFAGTETITYTVTDNQGATTTATITITVGAPPADAPVVSGVIAPQAGTDDLPITPINAGAMFSDPNGQPLVFSATGLPPGLVIDPATGLITGTLETDASVGGPDTVAVTAVDPDGNQVTTTVLLAILNPAPVAANDAAATPVDTPVTIAMLANDTDPDGDLLNISYVSEPAHGSVAINPDGTITYTPDDGFTGTDTFSYTVSDGQGGTEIATVTISVGAPLTGAPVAAGPVAPVIGIDGSPIAPVNVGSQITDPAGQPLMFSATGLPDGLVIDPLTGIITGTLEPGASADGPFTILITAVDPDGNQVTVPLVMMVTNPAPIAVNDTATTAADQPVVIGVLANDRDPDGEVITVTAATDPAHGTLVINPNGTITFIPDAGFTGADTFTYITTDANGATTTATVTVNIGTPGPLASVPAITPVIGQDGTTITPVAIGSAFGDADQTGPLMFSIDPAALPPGITFDPASGTFSGTPGNNASQGSTPGQPAGSYLVPVTATDTHGATTTTTVTFTFNNLPPVAVNDIATVTEDAAFTTGNVLTGQGTDDHDTAPDSDPVTVTLASQSGRPIVLGTPFAVTGGGLLTLNSDGAYNFIPGTAYNGLDTGDTATETISYTISDGNGGTATATLVITVTGLNNAPVVIDPRNPGTPANPILATDPLNIIPDVKTADSRSPAPVNVASYIRDPEGKPLTFSATGLPPGLSIDRNTGVITGTLSRSASQGATPGNPAGLYTVIVTARDPGGLTATTTITYTVANPPPVAVNDGPFVTDENRTVTVPVISNDTDPDGDPLHVIAASSPNGTVTINGDGSLSFTPAPGFAGTALITYEISDGEGGTSLATATVSVRPVVIGLSQPLLQPLPPARPSPHEPLSVDGAVIAAANSSYNLFGVGGFAGLSMANAIGDNASVMGVINALDAPGSLWTTDQSGSLGGEPSFLTSDGIVLAESAHINGLWQAGEMLRSPDLGSLGLGTLGGFSLRFSATQLEPRAPSGPDVLVDSIVTNGVLTLTFEQSGMVHNSRVVDYRITRLDGRPIPDWLQRTSVDMLQGRRAADAEVLDLRITAILSNGEAVTQDIRIQTMTGEIQPLPRQRAELSPPMFQEQFRSYASLSDRQSAALAFALAD